MKKTLAITCALFLINCIYANRERPNILWLTSEDNSAHYMRFMGDPRGTAPALDKLAAEGVVYERAYSNGAVCAVARSTILYGMPATSLGLQYQRCKNAVPENVKTHAEYMRLAGYYCTNNQKTDYNADIDHKAIWDECSRTAHYKNRADKTQPFFAVFNCEITHESNLFPEVIARNRKRGAIAQTPRVNPKDVEVPPYCPDTPEIREDIAVYYDCIESLDKFVGEKIKELEKLGEADDTIVFYYSDHGGILPREKRFVNDTGTHVPLIAYFPPKWKHLAPKTARCGDIISFIDLAPTILNLAGAEIPEAMTGVPFLGKNAAKKNKYSFAYADRFDECVFSLRRSVTDGTFRYIYNFYPQNPLILDCAYPFNQRGWQSWKREYEAKRTSGEQTSYWQKPQPVEQLFNTAQDKWEVEDLSGNVEFEQNLSAMRDALKTHMLATRDVGVIPEPMLVEIANGGNVYDAVRAEDFNYEAILNAAFLSSSMQNFDDETIVKLLSDGTAAVRYWGVMAAGRFLIRLPDSDTMKVLNRLANQDSSLANRIAICSLLSENGFEKQAARRLEKDLPLCKTPIQRFYLLAALKKAAPLNELQQGMYESAVKFTHTRKEQ